MNQPSYYKCSLFDQKIFDKTNFSFIQEEIKLKRFNENKSEFDLLKIKYDCKFLEKIKLSANKPVGLIPIKDNSSLLKYTLDNLSVFNVFEYIDFIVIDDRSTEDIKSICDKYPINYLRIDNNKGFNFSTLNNVGAKIAYDYGCKEIILWNADLWVDNKESIPNLIKLHRENDSTISGTRLLYPPFSWNNEEVSHNIESSFPNRKNSYRGTIQFGGAVFTYNQQFSTYFPNHFCRFKEKNYYLSKCDKLDIFVTGAFQIINLDWYIAAGGLNPSLSKNFQDVDICLRATEEEKKVYYFGDKNYLLHDESVTLSKNKNDSQFVSDHILYQKLWDINRFAIKIQKFEV